MTDTTTSPDTDAPEAPPLNDLELRMIASLAPPDLEAVALTLEDGTAETILEQWQPVDLDHASWAARHLARQRARLAEVKALVAEQRFRIAAFEERETAKLSADVAFFEGRLRGFHERALATDSRAKTIPLPDGTELRSQAGKLAVEVTDVEAFSRWAEQYELAGELLRLADPEPNKAEIAKRYTAKAEQEKDPGEYPAIVADTGETVPGVTIVRRPRTFTIGSPS